MSNSDPNGQLVFEFDRPPLALYTPDDIFVKADESLLRKLFEDSRLEFKPNGIQARALGDYFSMWGNTAPSGGLIVIGIRNDKEFEGCSKLSPGQLNDLELTGEIFCPDVDYTVNKIPIHRDSDGGIDFVLMFRIQYHQSKIIRTTSQGAFVRRANRKKELRSPEEIRLLQAEKGEIRFEVEACGVEFPNGFNFMAMAEFCATVAMKKGWDNNHELEDILSLMHLGGFGDGKFIPNVACALLFSKDPRLVSPGCRIRFLRFEGETEGVGDKWNAVKDEYIDGTIPEQIQRADILLKSQLRTFSRLGSGGKFFTSPEYPEFAWYEAIVNACVHRSYGNGLRNMTIFIKMFDDRLVVESPGPFPAFVTPHNIYEMHMPRNPFLMDAMLYLKFVKCAHEGTRRIKAEMLGMELPAPEFKQDEIGNAIVRVTLRNNIKQRKVWVDSDVVKILGAQIAHSLKEDEKRCINFCAEYGEIGVSDAQRLTGKSWPAAKSMLSRLEDKGILVHIIRKELQRDPQARFRLRALGSQETPTP